MFKLMDEKHHNDMLKYFAYVELSGTKLAQNFREK